MRGIFDDCLEESLRACDFGRTMKRLFLYVGYKL